MCDMYVFTPSVKSAGAPPSTFFGKHLPTFCLRFLWFGSHYYVLYPTQKFFIITIPPPQKQLHTCLTVSFQSVYSAYDPSPTPLLNSTRTPFHKQCSNDRIEFIQKDSFRILFEKGKIQLVALRKTFAWPH